MVIVMKYIIIKNLSLTYTKRGEKSLK